VQAEIVAEKIRLELARPYLLQADTEYFRSASVGISLFPATTRPSILLKQADIAVQSQGCRAQHHPFLRLRDADGAR
jgi:GGDEF domain-containing protein